MGATHADCGYDGEGGLMTRRGPLSLMKEWM